MNEKQALEVIKAILDLATSKGVFSKIDEFVLVANQDEAGFAIVRILGDDMDVNHVMTLFQLLKKSNVDMEQLKPLQQFMK